MNSRTCFSFFLTTAFLCGCGQKPAGPANPVDATGPKEKTIAIPADSFLLSVPSRPSVPTRPAPSEIRITVTLPCSPGGNIETDEEIKELAVKPNLYTVRGTTIPIGGDKLGPAEISLVIPVPRFGAAELGATTGPATPQGRPATPDGRPATNGAIDRGGDKTLVALIVKVVHKEGKAGGFFRFRHECGSEAKPAVMWGEGDPDHDYPLPNGQTLADVVKLDVEPGLYKIGSRVRLGTVRLEGVTHSLTVHVYWKDEEKK